MRLMDGCWLYILRCSDGSFYTGTTRTDVEVRVGQHNTGVYPRSFTFKRRPVALIYSDHFPNIVDAIAMERRIKGWSRQKKQAIIDGNWDLLPELAKRRGQSEMAEDPSALEDPSRRRFAAPQDED